MYIVLTITIVREKSWTKAESGIERHRIRNRNGRLLRIALSAYLQCEEKVSLSVDFEICKNAMS